MKFESSDILFRSNQRARQISVVFLLLLNLNSCKRETNPCHDPVTTKETLDEDNKKKIPYTGYDTLTFISNNGDTLRFAGQGKDSDWYCTERYVSADCPPYVDCY